ncbi:hypothetical protein [Neobacillus sp. D3-1R]|uniref:hypothetical protein n=1 Tax=Neobacillus sp. D3-1R TaxID=3445778 RepID=UPI003F9ECCEF
MTKYLGIHEALELHELLTFKNLCVTKAATMSALVQDETLKNLLANDAQSGSEHISQLQKFLTKREDII